MRISILPAAVLLLAITSTSFAAVEYHDSDSDYVGGNSDISDVGCVLRGFAHPQKKEVNFGYHAADTTDITVEYQGPYDKSDKEYILSKDYDREKYNSNFCNRISYNADGELQQASAEPARIIFKQQNKVYAEYIGQVSDGVLINGRYTFSNGEVWSVGSNGTETILKPSQAKIKAKQIASADFAKKDAKYMQQLTKFRKNIKAGSRVSCVSGSSTKQGIVTSAKGNLVKVQVTEEVISGVMRGVRPYEVLVTRNDIRYP